AARTGPGSGGGGKRRKPKRSRARRPARTRAGEKSGAVSTWSLAGGGEVRNGVEVLTPIRFRAASRVVLQQPAGTAGRSRNSKKNNTYTHQPKTHPHKSTTALPHDHTRREEML